MKKTLVVLALIFLALSTIYPQSKQKKADVYLCRNDGQNIIIDENCAFTDSSGANENKYNSIESLVAKYIGEQKRGEPYFFKDYQKWMVDFTKMKMEEEYYVSTQKNVYKGKVSGYKLWNNDPAGYDFSPVLKLNTELAQDTTDDNKNIYVCSKYKNISKIITKEIKDKELIKKLTAFLDKYTSDLVVDTELTTDEPPEIKVIEANFLNSDKKEYVVSYCKRIAFDKYASGIFIVSEIGKVAYPVIEFSTEFTYFKLLGVVDYDGDGQFEVLCESGYYEGIGYELYKKNGNKYDIITCGFYWGV